MAAIRLILGDQLSEGIATLKGCRAEDIILLAEVREEASYVRHHKKKIAFIFSAMRHFGEALLARGYTLRYVRLDDPHNSGSLKGEVRRLVSRQRFTEIIVTEPGEYRLLREMRGWERSLGLPVTILPDARFIASHADFGAWAEGRQQLIMEYWYRLLRRRTGLLMDGDKPEGGQWNYDQQNRKRLKPGTALKGPLWFEANAQTEAVLRLVRRHFPNHFGDLQPFRFAVTGAQAEQALAHFIEYQLPRFGDYQDAMQSAEPFLFHSVISQYINCGLLDPLAVCKQVERAYYRGAAPLNAVEGFIRQIIGWREFMRGIYWRYMPDYARKNVLRARRPLPAFYWNAETDMRCVSEVVGMTRRHAYSHHIQRLMVTGNFAALAGLDVKQVSDWYLAVYADAYEWVELPNTLGMALHADGGLVGTKPYISSGAYIHRMSDFCGRCRFDPKRRAGPDACPFTTLYWDYLMRHESRFKQNPRMALAYRNLDRFDAEQRRTIRKQVRDFLNRLN